MLEKLKDFKDTFGERIRSPFVGSLIITWSLIHWKIYALFLFTQDKITIADRISQIEVYLKSKDFCDLFLNPVLITLGVLFAYNILNAVGLVIKLLYDNWASPYIQNKLYNKNIIEKPKYEKLKREYTIMRKEYDDDKENYINSENQRKTIDGNFEAFRETAFEGQFLSDITAALNKNVQWEHSFTLLDGRSGSELFNCDSDGFTLSNGEKIKIENIKITKNGKILFFNKVIDNKVHPNYLIRDDELNYHGVEDENTIVSYRKKKNRHIIIVSAIYKSESNFINVKSIIQKLVDSNTKEFTITNDLMGGDPNYGKIKTLEIIYTIDGKQETLIGIENEVMKI